jgi:hypothetical protein
LSEEKDLERALVDSHVDLDMALRAADAVVDFLDKRLDKPFERYMVARLVSILYEETLNCSLGPKFEAKIRAFAKQNKQ